MRPRHSSNLATTIEKSAVAAAPKIAAQREHPNHTSCGDPGMLCGPAATAIVATKVP
jgi:hypothetical protein